MYKLPIEIKKIATYSLYIAILISVILLLIKPILVIYFILGYLCSIINLYRNNYIITKILYQVVENKKSKLIMNYSFGYLIYFLVLLFGFYMGILEGFIVASGIIVIKIVIILSSIFVKDGDITWY